MSLSLSRSHAGAFGRTVILAVLVSSAFVPAAESKTARVNPYVAEASNPGGMGIEALVTKWVQEGGDTDHATIIAQPNLLGLVTVDLLDGLAWLARSSPRIGDRSTVIESLQRIVAASKLSSKARAVAIVGLLSLARDSQSIDLSLDHLLAQGEEADSALVLTYMAESCVLTRAQRERARTRPRVGASDAGPTPTAPR